ncbi:MAG TPA: BadF/BadG/BcrA/BcrD ATPase family protein [Rhodanobacteraceae bacterium]
MPTVLAIDLGRSGCRAALWTGDEPGPSASATGVGSIGLGAAHGPQVAASAILAVAAPLLAQRHVRHIDAVGAGVAGAMGASAAARDLAQQLLARLPVDGAVVTSDAITSHAGALAGEPGVVLAAGTGAVALAIGPGGRFRRVDGLGPWFGDAGSGAWIGREGLYAAARASDGRAAPTRLRDAAEAQFGPLSNFAVRLGSEPNPARVLATFAPAVADAARSGDAAARRIIERAAAVLAEAVVAAAQALHPAPAVATVILGGLTGMGPVLLDPLRAALATSAVALHLQAPCGTSLDGAYRIAAFAGGIHAPWVVRVDRPKAEHGALPLATPTGTHS